MSAVTDLRPAEVWRTQYRALLRLQLYFTGRTHKQLHDLAQTAQATILTAAGRAEGALDDLGLLTASRQIAKAWAATFAQWQTEFEVLRREAAAIAFGGLSVLHENYVRPALRAAVEARVINAVFDPQLQAVIDAANRRVYGDGFRLSQRLWRLEHESLNGLQQVLYNGVVNGRSAWTIAKDLEQYLGFGADCPRWTSTRLRLTKKQIAAGDVRGLKRGEECRGQGVAYNALRLARNELQVIHGLATDEIMAALPFIGKEQIFLSPSHPEDDECDQVIRDGEDGRGIYPKGTISLPLHVQCLCGKVAVLPSPDTFTDQLRGWLKGSQPWPEMDQYQTLMGGNVHASAADLTVLAALMTWAFGDLTVITAWLKGSTD